MDKWDDLTTRIQNAILAQEPEAAAAAGFQLICEFGRTLELIGEDIGRIADALEKTEITAENADENQGTFDL